VSLYCLFVLYLMARDDCVSGLSETENPETQSPLAIRYRTNRQSRDTITSGHKIQNNQRHVCLFCILWPEVIVSLDFLFVLYLMARGDCVSGLSVCPVSYGQR
jgi:hypothetical protein